MYGTAILAVTASVTFTKTQLSWCNNVERTTSSFAVLTFYAYTSNALTICILTPPLVMLKFRPEPFAAPTHRGYICLWFASPPPPCRPNTLPARSQRDQWSSRATVLCGATYAATATATAAISAISAAAAAATAAASCSFPSCSGLCGSMIAAVGLSAGVLLLAYSPSMRCCLLCGGFTGRGLSIL